MQLTIEHVASVRAQLWDAGFRPVPVFNADHPERALAGKAPLGNGWGDRARQNPPDCLRYDPVPHALNTGILCDGLRAIDIDIDDAAVAAQCRALIVQRFGEAPIRMRRNSPRCLILYRAANGEPKKVTLAGTAGKIEILGKGQQFVAFGRHPSGADLEWFPDAPGEEALDALPVVSEDDLTAALHDLAPLIGAAPPTRVNGESHIAGEAQADPLRVAAALAAIPNHGPADWEAWNRIGMAVWRATAGSDIGWQAFNVWSARNPAYLPEETRRRWSHYFASPPTEIGAGTLFHMAREPLPEPLPPATPTDAGYWASIEADDGMSEAEWLELERRESGRSIPAQAKAGGKELLWSITEPWNPADIPTRPWVARGYLLRSAVTVLSGPGSAGKSSLVVAWATALAIGSALQRFKPISRCRVMVYNVEDNADEQKRRFSAMLTCLGLTSEDLHGHLSLVGPREVGTLLHFPREGGPAVNTPVMDRLEALVAEWQPDVLFLDPFVELHAAEENDNTAVRAVMARFRSLATEHKLAVGVLHHSRKGAGDPGDPDTLRGASSIVGAARIVLTVNTMTEEEARGFGIAPERRRTYFRLDGAKSNYAAIEEAEWFERRSTPVGNTKEGEEGDEAAPAWPWRPPNLWVDKAPSDINAALDRIAAGPAPGVLYVTSRRGRGERWVGRVLLQVLGVNEDVAKRMLNQWLKSGLLYETEYEHPEWRRPVSGVAVDDSKRPSP